MGRPKKEIDKKQFESLCALQCTKMEICDFFEVTDKTLDGWCERTYSKSFSDIFSIKRNKGKVSLRRSQIKLAEKNAAMAIFLGKVYLGQKEDDREAAEALGKLDKLIDGITDAAKK